MPLPDGQRAQDYAASLRLAVGSVAELSRSTQTVLDTVRSLGGAVESVDYGTPSAGSGSALIDLRIPVARSQDALRQFSALGTITSQQVQIRDLQSGLDQETNRARALRRRIALLQAKLLSPALTPEARVTLEGRLADSQTALESVLRGVHATQQRAAFARFSLALVTGSGTAVAPPPKPGAFGRTADDALGVISVAGRGALFAAIVGGPFLLIAGGAWWLARRLRRRAARRLLETLVVRSATRSRQAPKRVPPATASSQASASHQATGAASCRPRQLEPQVPLRAAGVEPDRDRAERQRAGDRERERPAGADAEEERQAEDDGERDGGRCQRKHAHSRMVRPSGFFRVSPVRGSRAVSRCAGRTCRRPRSPTP